MSGHFFLPKKYQTKTNKYAYELAHPNQKDRKRESGKKKKKDDGRKKNPLSYNQSCCLDKFIYWLNDCLENEFHRGTCQWNGSDYGLRQMTRANRFLFRSLVSASVHSIFCSLFNGMFKRTVEVGVEFQLWSLTISCFGFISIESISKGSAPHIHQRN